VSELYVEKYADCPVFCASGFHKCIRAGLHAECVFSGSSYPIICPNGCGHQQVVDCISPKPFVNCPGVKVIKCSRCSRTKSVICSSNETFFCGISTVLKCRCGREKHVPCDSRETSFNCGITRPIKCDGCDTVTGTNRCHESVRSKDCGKTYKITCYRCHYPPNRTVSCPYQNIKWCHHGNCLNDIGRFLLAHDPYTKALQMLKAPRNRFDTEYANGQIRWYNLTYGKNGIYSIEDLLKDPSYMINT
jgi:hypothetical protein